MSASPFRTPPLDRSTDGNNNAINFSTDPRGRKLEDRFANPPIPCDGCGVQFAGLILRWCDDCCATICDACILDHHGGHGISWYLEATRYNNRKFDDILEKAKCDMKRLHMKLIQARRFQKEIKSKIMEMKTKVQRREKESFDMVPMISQRLIDLTRLGGAVLNAQAVCDRRYTANDAIILGGSLVQRQGSICNQLNRIDGIVAEMKGKIGGSVVEQPASGGDDDDDE